MTTAASPYSVLLSVSDDSPTGPIHIDATDEDITGRGISIVAG